MEPLKNTTRAITCEPLYQHELWRKTDVKNISVSFNPQGNGDKSKLGEIIPTSHFQCHNNTDIAKGEHFIISLFHTYSANWLEIISVMEITSCLRGLLIRCPRKWADVFIVFCTRQMLLSFFQPGPATSSDSGRARWIGTWRCGFKALHHCNT